MRNQLLTYVTSTILFFMGCSSDKIETKPDPCANKQVPGNYFPAYPKTWWTYRNQQNQLVKFEISGDYELYSGKCLPKFLNLSGFYGVYVDGESFFTDHNIGQGHGATDYSVIYSLIRDSSFICPVAFSKMSVNHSYMIDSDIKTRRMTAVLDTTVTLPNSHIFTNVIIVKEYYTYWTGSNNYYYNDYFAKNVGLIKRLY